MKQLPLKTKSIYDRKEDSDGKRVLVTRYYPRGVKRTHFDLWLRSASPEIALLKEYRSDNINWEEFSKRFKIQLRTNPESKKAVSDIIDMMRNEENLTLLCYEREGENCHRFLLKVFIEKMVKKKSKTGKSKSQSGSGEGEKE